MGRRRNSSAMLFSLFLAALAIPSVVFAEDSENITKNESALNGSAFIASSPPVSVSDLRIASGSAISTIDPVRASVRLKNSFWSSWAGGIPDVFDSYNITYTIRLQYCLAFLFGACVWWYDFSPVKEKSYSNVVYVIKAFTSAKLQVDRHDNHVFVYDYDPLNIQSTEAAENWAESLMNSMDDVTVGYLDAQDSGKTVALTVTVKGYAENNLRDVPDYIWNIAANSANSPLAVTVTSPPDPALEMRYRLDGTWYSFSTPIRINNSKSRNVDFYVANIGSGPTSNDGFVSISVDKNLDISDRGSGYLSASYPQGSQLGGKCQVASSDYKLLDTWAKYDAGQSRYISTKLTGKSLGDGWIKVRAGFDTPANGLNTVDDPRAGETSEQDQQCFPAYRIPVMVGECFSSSDCGSDGYIGSPFCSNDDVLQSFRRYACNASYRCTYTESNYMMQDCGDDYCDAWQNAYCENGNQLWHKRECYDNGCSDNACFNKKSTETQKVQDCTGKTDPWSTPYCASGQIVHSRGLYDGSCAGLTPARCDYNYKANEIEPVDNCADYCEGWSANYCKGDDVFHSVICRDRGCNIGDTRCYVNTNVKEEKIKGCALGCDGGECITCIKDEDCGGWTGAATCCRYEYGAYICGGGDNQSVWQNKNVCLNNGTRYSSCSTKFMLKETCGEDSYTGNYCYNDDVYRNKTDKGCSSGGCFASNIQEKVQECGDSYCGQWSSDYCKWDSVYHSRNCTARGCSGNSCFANQYTNEWIVKSCPAETICSGGTCVCTDGCSAGQARCSGNYRQTCGNYDADSCLEWGSSILCPQGCANSECIVQLQGDADRNCRVDIFDLAKVGICYGCLLNQECWPDCSNADLSKNNAVDIFDLATVGLNYGRSC